MQNKATRKPIRSVQRALDVLEAVARRPDGLALRDIAQEIGLKSPTAYHLAETLVARGYLRKRRSPIQYLLGPAPGELLLHEYEGGWQRRVEAAVLSLSRSFPAATVVYAVMTGSEVEVKLRASPELAGRLQRPQQRVLSPYTSASALMAQAVASAEALAEYRRNYPFAEYGASRWGTMKRLTAFLERARRTGRVVLPFARGDADHLCMAVPLPQATLPSTLGVSWAAATGAAAAAVVASVIRERDACSNPSTISAT